MDMTPVTAWGGRTTPFQLAGQPPVERRPLGGSELPCCCAPRNEGKAADANSRWPQFPWMSM